MRGISYLLSAVLAMTSVIVYMARASEQADGKAPPIFGVQIPPGYRDWKLISVAHEEGNNNDIRAILGNDIAIKAYREEQLPFPDGTIIARLAWSYVASEENKQGLWACSIFRCRRSHKCSVHGQGLKKIRGNGRLGIRSIQRRQTYRRGAAQTLLSLSRAD